MSFSQNRESSAPLGGAHASTLDSDERLRYSRQIGLPAVGFEGQTALKNASVLIVGAGGLGSPAAMYLAAAGIGRIGIADADVVEVTNLHRQLLHRTQDVGRPKVESALATLRAINPHVRVDAVDQRVSRDNALDLVRSCDVVIDGTDNFPTRYLLNDACVLTARPLIYGSVDRFDGQVSVFATDRGPCYRCLFPTPPEPGTIQNCADAGVLGVLPGLIGMLQATEALKLILGVGEPLVAKLLLVDTLSSRFRTISIERDANCPACGTREIDSLVDYEDFCHVAPPPKSNASTRSILPRELSSLLSDGRPVVVLDVREPHEWQIARIPTARLVPLRRLLAEGPGIGPDSDVVVYCHHGPRAQAAVDALVAIGFRTVRNLDGGIDRWSREVDPTVPRY